MRCWVTGWSAALCMWLVVMAVVPASADAEDKGQPAILAAATIYLSPKGNDANPGTRDRPKLSFIPAYEALVAGQTLVLLPGDYEVHGQCRKSLVGTESQPITIRGEGHARLFSNYEAGGDASVQLKMLIERSSYLTFQNLDIEGGGFVVGTRSEHITIRDCHIHDYSNYAIITWMPKHLLIENCNIHGSWMEHGIYLSKDTKDVVIRNCEISDTAINGIHINSSDIEHVLVENCVFHQNSRNWGASITILGARDVTIRNNVFYSNLGHIFTITGGKNADTQAQRNINILFNTIYQPRGGRNGKVFIVESPLSGTRVIGNVFDTNSEAFSISPDYVTNTTSFDCNVYGQTAGKPLADIAGQEAHAIYGADLKYVSAPGWKDQKANLHLRAGSIGAIDAPLLKEDVPSDIGDQPRKQGGAFGAYAAAAQ